MAAHGFEAMLLGWANTSTRGPTITLALADEIDLVFFQKITMAKGRGVDMVGQRLMFGCSEIGDDEQPVAQPPVPTNGAGDVPVQITGVVTQEAQTASVADPTAQLE